MSLHTSDFDFDLPPHLIAQKPAERREASRLLVVNRTDRTLTDSTFSALGTFLSPGDLLVANRSKVLPARIAARKRSGGEVELLLVRSETPTRWTALARPGRRLRQGVELSIAEGLCAHLLERRQEGLWLVQFDGDGDVAARVAAAGVLPLPPYIHDNSTPADRYQTVYADREGSVAAPTAGLHFSADLLAELRSSGIGVRFVTLHVGLGTFRPVVVQNIREHTMHAEWGEVPHDVVDAVQQTRAHGGRIVAVGTTTTRLLESAWQDGDLRPFTGDTDIFLYPGYRFRVIDALVTNFHLPRSTLLMLVSAFADRDLIMHAYAHAIAAEYRFYSFGDAMLLL